ncbi:glycosyltransferase [Chitinophagaceae bacterium MMS25-I14]
MTPENTGHRRIKIALYCHNRDGLGHIIRSIRIGESLLETGLFEPVLLTGCRALGSIYIPQGLAVHQLTPIPPDRYDPNVYAILKERVMQIREFMDSFSPDMVLVDSVPLGYMKELRSVLDAGRQNPGGTMFILGLPYAPDELTAIIQNPNDRAAFSVYSYGLIYDDESEPAYSNIPFPLMTTGLVGGPLPPVPDPSSKVILVLAGGGAVSLSLLAPLIRATASVRQQGFTVRFVTGPLADHQHMLTLIDGQENFELVAVSSSEEALQDARLVIARCGYNTAATLVRTDLPLIFIPYCSTETDEQFTRAEKLSKLDNVIMINPLKGEIDAALEQSVGELLYSDRAVRFTGDAFSGSKAAARYLSEMAQQLLQTT